MAFKEDERVSFTNDFFFLKEFVNFPRSIVLDQIYKIDNLLPLAFRDFCWSPFCIRAVD